MLSIVIFNNKEKKFACYTFPRINIEEETAKIFNVRRAILYSINEGYTQLRNGMRTHSQQMKYKLI